MPSERDVLAARLAAIVESSDDAIIGKDLEGFITSWNAGAQRLFGYAPDEIVGQHITTIIPFELRAEEEDDQAELRAGRSVRHFETVRCRRDGSRVDVSITVSPILAPDGTLVGASKIARDISGRRGMERDALRLAALVASSDDAIISKDLNGVIQSWNLGAEQIFGYTAEEAIGRNITLIIPEERYEEEVAVIAQIRRGERISHFETVRRHKDGHLIDVSLTVSPIQTASGAVVGASKIARDISEQKRMRSAAEEASRSKDIFLATLSHELRTPLNTVLGYTHMLQRGVLRPEDLNRALGAISRNAESLTQLVNDVLDASRIVTGKMRLKVRRCDLGEIVESAIETVRPAARAKSLHVEEEYQRGVFVNGDPDRLRQVIWNVLSNAVKFTPPNGTVHVSLKCDGTMVRATIADTGVGIAPEALGRVFDRFWQADSTHSRPHGGLGLGLSLVRHLTELHGGRVTARSPGLDRGATFDIDLPADPPA